MPNLTLRPMTPGDHPAVAQLVFTSTNHWYQQHTGRPIFTCDPADCALFTDVYHALDPGQSVVVEDTATGRLAGSCFVHPRKTHVSLGIMNAAPEYAGQGVARRLLQHATGLADQRGLPTRLISSAMNLDSFSLYNRAGFTPTAVYQDMLVTVPDEGLPPPEAQAGVASDPPPRVRPATPDDVPAIDALEQHIAGISRPDDWRYFITNTLGVWHTAVAESSAGQLTGVLASVHHPASSIVGPGVMHDDPAALALLHHHLNQHPGQTRLVLAPANRPGMTKQLYAWKARNCELHVTQTRGESPAINGITLPTFMPETG